MWLAIFDFTRIAYTSNYLENQVNDIADIYKKNYSTKEIENYLKLNDTDLKYSIKKDGEYNEIIISKNLDIVTPGLNLILGSDYQLKSQRTVINETE